MKKLSRKHVLALAAVTTMSLSLPLCSIAAGVNIQVDGNAVNFDQPPIERGGRVYVPLRGVFERLGAAVSYANGFINAQGNGHNITLKIGARSATVDGSSVAMDSPAFLVGSRTLVPLRFVAQALGAGVDYNGNTRVVAITSAGGSSGPVNTGTSNNNNGNNNSGSVTLQNLNPADGGATSSNAPIISGTFSAPVDPNSVRIRLDGRDISNIGTYVASDRFQITVPNLPPTSHTVQVSGNAQGGGSFNQSFTFTSGTDTSKPFVNNVRINGVAASNGMQVPQSYTMTGTTIPHGEVQILIGYQTSLFGGLIPIGGNTAQQQVTADANGRWNATIDSSTIGSPSQYSIALRAINTGTKAISNPVQLTVHL